METNKLNETINMEDTVCTIQETMCDRYYKISNSKMRMLKEYGTMTAKIIAPYVVAVCHAWLHHQRTLLEGLRRNIITVVIATITSRFSLRLISVGELLRGTSKLDPLLSTFKVINFKPRQLLWAPVQENARTSHELNKTIEPEKSVHCQILYDPGPGKITADVIFIHGLKGSLDRTWKQGEWNLKKCERGSRVLINKSCSASVIGQNRVKPGRRIAGSESDLTKGNNDKVLWESNNNENGSNGDVVFTCGNEGVIEMESNGDSRLASNENYDSSTTWNEKMTSNSKEDVSLCWPRDWLPKDCPGVRVIALNYTTDPYLWRPIWISKRSRTSMQERGWEMIEHLVKLGVGNHPIVWVGHSKGGLFVKQMLVHGCESSIEAHSQISKKTKGILFYSVPHRGSPLANLNLPLLRQSIELTEVQKDSNDVLELHKKFHSLVQQNQIQVEVRSFIETTLTLMSLFYVRIVSVESADAEIGDLYGVPTDHRNICKPRSRDCFLYKELIDLIDSVCAKRST
ncbi:uncharacterized protein LOC111063546 [Nilaparvata lugens]|uniref:uncharacterized protein LOC111063546 n=1 Tax=Nilaparvata lugens TaxID=108931 RepID=UPI00193E2590|nr:uncharacterized protein LOC111063546 [Nilaparvata lugens]